MVLTVLVDILNRLLLIVGIECIFAAIIVCIEIPRRQIIVHLIKHVHLGVILNLSLAHLIIDGALDLLTELVILNGATCALVGLRLSLGVVIHRLGQSGLNRIRGVRQSVIWLRLYLKRKFLVAVDRLSLI